MDSFESVVETILHRRGYWTQVSVKVELTKAQKRRIRRPSSPRWELDIVGYRARSNALLVLECKSFLDSPGVRVATFEGKRAAEEERYKLFFDSVLRRVVFDTLARQSVQRGLCRARPKVQLGLAAGRIHGDEDVLARLFRRKGWVLWGPGFLRSELEALKAAGYENSIASVVTKLLLRSPAGHRAKSDQATGHSCPE